MKQKASKMLPARLAPLMLAAVVILVSGNLATAQSHESASKSSLTGTWMVQVTLTDCATGDALPGVPFSSLVTFHRGGTITESAGTTAFAPGQRSTGHGTWDQRGDKTYLQKVMALILFASPANIPGTPGFNPALPISPGFEAGWSTITHTITMIDADHFRSSGGNEFFKLNGQAYRNGCSAAVGVRFE